MNQRPGPHTLADMPGVACGGDCGLPAGTD